MLHLIKKLLITHLPLKIISLILAFGLWASLNKSQMISRSFTVPVCFFNTTHRLSIHAPETISITLKGPRDIMRMLGAERLAVHINSGDLSSGETPIALTGSHLLLPESVKLVHYSPLPVIVSSNTQGQNEQISTL